MSKSKAKKRREKLVREGKRNPSENRGVYALTDMRTRKTKTKKEVLSQVKHKSRLSYESIEDKSTFYFVLKENELMEI
ncbi:hypothetical protein AN964_10320 [Heyndrickxia shackletonii]|uniref:Uncharacterized protein n=1 Tax=Heyndrickxia shackletonii TaxID=157838 RepID=A0A0Q3TIU2_9BACI|nr:hypothetical protein [Heyndrickxia shackletonii]KQL53854.1 hypothetical protein AN964_10320 [Heyndrickxia shackletonii]NEY97873.1 hypothetical protein [Heyndrickxia shackletonii]